MTEEGFFPQPNSEISYDQNLALTQSVTDQEISKALSSINTNKALGLDGFIFSRILVYYS